jgi:hypothetical protein
VLTEPRPSAVLANLFLRALCATILQGAGVVAFARGSYWACVTAFIIQAVWSSNSRAINDHRPRGSSLTYGAGGACGAFVVLKVSGWM